MLMNLAKSKKWMRCPKCKFYVERSEGCLFMRCRFGSFSLNLNSRVIFLHECEIYRNLRLGNVLWGWLFSFWIIVCVDFSGVDIVFVTTVELTWKIITVPIASDKWCIVYCLYKIFDVRITSFYFIFFVVVVEQSGVPTELLFLRCWTSEDFLDNFMLFMNLGITYGIIHWFIFWYNSVAITTAAVSLQILLIIFVLKEFICLFIHQKTMSKPKIFHMVLLDLKIIDLMLDYVTDQHFKRGTNYCKTNKITFTMWIVKLTKSGMYTNFL